MTERQKIMLITPFGDDSIQVSFDQFKRFYAHKKAPESSLNLFKLLDGAGQTSTATRMAKWIEDGEPK